MLPLLSLLAGGGWAQVSGMTSPGAPGLGDSGQTDRFSRDFNPAISLAVDLVGDWLDQDGGEGDGTAFDARRLDLLFASWIDPSAWAYATLAYEEDELQLDEVAIHYVGLPQRHSLKAGRFFVDFGKQMQAHLEELATVERPLVLREYLGEELAGDGVQWDWWRPLGDRTVLRTSAGLFMDLVSGHEHGHEEEHDADGATARPQVEDRLDFDELSYTLRATALTEASPRVTVQGGVSLRQAPSFSLAREDLLVSDLSNSILGLDLTWSRRDATSTRVLTLGGELLSLDGDLGLSSDARVLDGRRTGFFVWGELELDRYRRVGAQYSEVELPLEEGSDLSELDLFYTQSLSEFLRLRTNVTLAEGGTDSTRVAVQLVGYVGPHGHGLNW